MKQLILIALLVVCISPTAIKAQEVYKDASGKFILDMTEPTGMPQNAVTSTKKIWSSPPSNTDSIPNNKIRGSINATLYHKLEIAPNDMNTSGAMDGTGTMLMSWVDAFNGCKNSNYDGGGWRMPTQRELQLIYIFKQTFVTNLGIGPFSANYYWTATESDNYRNAISIQGSSGYFTSGYLKSIVGSLVRCVREL